MTDKPKQTSKSDEAELTEHINSVMEIAQNFEQEELFQMELVIDEEELAAMDASQAEHYKSLQYLVDNTLFLSESDQIKRYNRYNEMMKKISTS